jgi:hypothetical protein
MNRRRTPPNGENLLKRGHFLAPRAAEIQLLTIWDPWPDTGPSRSCNSKLWFTGGPRSTWSSRNWKPTKPGIEGTLNGKNGGELAALGLAGAADPERQIRDSDPAATSRSFPEQIGSATVYAQVCHMPIAVSAWTGGAKNLLKKAGGAEMRLAFRAALAIQRESPLGGCAAGMANLGGGGHPGCAGVATRSNSISTPATGKLRRGDAETRRKTRRG